MEKKKKSVFSPILNSNRAFEEEKSNGDADVAWPGAAEEEDWRRFREAGFLDESQFWRKDRAALVETIERLEKELYDYQYNMGLLLMEKENWNSEHENIRQAVTDLESKLEREQRTRLIHVADLEKQEENLRKALGLEKQCVNDLENALKEMSAELETAKLASEKKQNEDHALKAILEDKYLEVRGSLHSGDAKLAEASRRSTEVDIRLQEVEKLERRLQKERLLFMEEREHDEHISRQQQDLQALEKRLMESEERLINKKEVLEQEGDVSNILQTIATKEKDVDMKLMNVEKKERELLDMEDKLTAENVEIQILRSEKEDFELELEKKKKSFEENMNVQMNVLEKKKSELNCREDLIRTSELSLKDREKNADEKGRSLEEREEFLKAAEKKIKDENEQLVLDTEKLVILKEELESLRAAVDNKEKLTCKEKDTILSLKTELEQKSDILTKETEDLSLEKNKLEKQREAIEEELKQLSEEKERFQNWRVIEEEKLRKGSEELILKKETLEKEHKDFAGELEKNLQKKFLEKLREKDMLKKEHPDFARELECEMHRKFEENLRERETEFERRDIQRTHELEKKFDEKLCEVKNEFNKRELEKVQELEELRLKKEALEKENADLARELESKLQSKFEEQLREMQTEFERRNLHKTQELEELRLKKEALEKENANIASELESKLQRKLDENLRERENDFQKREKQKKQDIDTLQKDLVNEREEFAKEKERLLGMFEQFKTCKSCGFVATQGLQTPHEINIAENRAMHPTEGQASKSILFGSKIATLAETYHSPDTGEAKGNETTLEKKGKDAETIPIVSDTNNISEKEGDITTPPTKSGWRNRPKATKRAHSVEEKEKQENKGEEVSENLVDVDEMESSESEQEQESVKNESDSDKEWVINDSGKGSRKKQKTSPSTPTTVEKKRYNFRASTIQKTQPKT